MAPILRTTLFHSAGLHGKEEEEDFSQGEERVKDCIKKSIGQAEKEREREIE